MNILFWHYKNQQLQRLAWVVFLPMYMCVCARVYLCVFDHIAPQGINKYSIESPGSGHVLFRKPALSMRMMRDTTGVLTVFFTCCLL